MNFIIVPMTADYARLIVGWKYPAPYDVYDYFHEADDLLDEANWGNTRFAVLDENHGIVGELTLGFLDRSDEWVSQEEMEAGKLEGCILWLGFGLRPDLTGQGLGPEFVRTCSAFAELLSRRRYHYPGDEVGLGVYQFNQRAIKAYERAGFEKYMEERVELNGKEEKAQSMKKKFYAQSENCV